MKINTSGGYYQSQELQQLPLQPVVKLALQELLMFFPVSENKHIDNAKKEKVQALTKINIQSLTFTQKTVLGITICSNQKKNSLQKIYSAQNIKKY